MEKPQVKVTSQGFNDLKNELGDLIKKRPGVLERMVAAREQGDLSENAGYHAAKEELAEIDHRARELKVLIRFAQVVDNHQKETVELGSVVTISGEGVRVKYSIVGELEADPAKGKISDKSPIGTALIAKKVGEKISISTPEGQSEYQIEEIEV